MKKSLKHTGKYSNPHEHGKNFGTLEVWEVPYLEKIFQGPWDDNIYEMALTYLAESNATV